MNSIIVSVINCIIGFLQGFKKRVGIYAILIFALVFSCKVDKETEQERVQIAFMADVHLQDIYGNFLDSDYKGVLNPKTGKFTLARTMQSQLQSTRLFNENYFAFIAALDDVVKREIKYVVLPGDFSDDGQALNIRGLKRILDKYSRSHNIQFVLTTGNHDPVKPFYQDAGKSDFLGKDGKNQPVYSKQNLFSSKDTTFLPVVITKDIAKLGYSEILSELKGFGFFPKKTDVYWETPFSTYIYDSYEFDKAINQSKLDKRTYKVSPYNSGIPDVSYLVEPADNLWFLAIDANVYVPKKRAETDALNPKNYNSASIGYNNVLTHKRYLLDWVKSVAERAEKLGKTLIVFSHYPTIDFNDDASAEIKALFGGEKMQSHRVPDEAVAKAFANADVKVHFGGHMHINDTGVRTFNSDNFVNVQVPSLAAYIPAYKLVTVSKTDFEVETIVIDSVTHFNTLFPLYEQEHTYLESKGDSLIWNKDILKTKSYKDFTQFHLKELVRLRFLNNDWPIEFRDLLLKSTGKDLLFSTGKTNNTDIDVEEFEKWTGYDMIFDFYRLRSADELAINDIGINRLKQYQIVCDAFKNSEIKDLKLWGRIFEKASHGEPADHFRVNLKEGTIKRIIP
ncbi:MAG: metallophosphoesterase [Algibacter sp.]